VNATAAEQEAGGRNAFHRRDASALIEALSRIVHDNLTAGEALELFHRQSSIGDGEAVYEADLPRGTTFGPPPRATWIEDALTATHSAEE
jgi:hypothetical protein